MRSRGLNSSQRGDTIIEVLLAIGILGMLVTITYTAMTRAMGVAYNSLDRTNTQAMVNGQANLLRAAHSKYITAVNEEDKDAWQAITDLVVQEGGPGANSTAAREDGCSFGVNRTSNAFFFDPAGGAASQLLPIKHASARPINNVRDITNSSQPVLGNGIWVEGYQLRRANSSIDTRIYTFYIKSCTPPIYGDGSDVNRQTKTVVRLYAE